MRTTALATGLAIGILGLGAATAVADPVPISIDITGGTVKPGPYAETATTGTGRLVGTIDSTTFAATFPAAGNSLPSVTIPDVQITDLLGTAYSGPLTVDAVPGAFSGTTRVSGTDVALDLSGPVTYTFKAGSTTCTGSVSNATLTGAPIDFVSGAYSASGSAPAPTFSSLNRICIALGLRLPSTAGTVATSITGKLTIPGLIPLPTVAVVPAPTTSTTPAPAPTPTAVAPAPTAVAKPGRLSVTVSRPATVTRGRSTVTKIVLRNTGAGTARGVKVKLAAAKGVSPRSLTKTYAAIGAGKVRTINVRLRTTSKAAKRSTLKVTASGTGGLSATRSTTVRLR